jgi:ATP-dependent Clp protease ATP-binding subunit ClpA
MFERFTEEARQVVVLAQEEASQLRHSYIGTEHILLGLLRDEERRPKEERPLRALGVTLVDARDRVARLVGAGEEATSGRIPFTPRAKKVLELALREALGLGHEWIGPEHILLGVAGENEGVASRVLLEFDADAGTIRGVVLRILADMPRPPRSVVERRLGQRVPMETAWFDGLGDVLAVLAREIRQELGREPDAGDLLLTIACARETLAARALRELGVDLDALWGTLERVRQEDADAGEKLEQRIETVQEAKRQALQNERFQDAARLRDEQRELIEQRRSHADEGLLQEVRARLGLPTPED